MVRFSGRVTVAPPDVTMKKEDIDALIEETRENNVRQAVTSIPGSLEGCEKCDRETHTRSHVKTPNAIRPNAAEYERVCPVHGITDSA